MTATSADIRFRSLDVVPVDRLAFTPITVVGGGAIGSWVALGLTKSGAENVQVYDGDRIEVHNTGPQLYGLSSEGEYKVEALRAEIKRLTEAEIDPRPGHVTSEVQLRDGIVISAVDSMEARSLIWAKVKERAPSHQLYIEGRMGAEVGIIYAGDPEDEKFQSSYEATLYSDEQAEELPCMARATAYCGLWIGAMIARHVVSFLRGGEVVPFEVIGDLRTLLSYVNESP